MDTNARLFDLDGRVAVVVGGAHHLGRDMAEALAAAGAAVAVTSRDGEAARRAAAEVAESCGTPTLGLAADVTDADSLAAVAAAVRDWRGAPDVLVNNAGGGSGKARGNLFEREIAVIRTMIEVNLTGTLLSCRTFGAAMREAGRGGAIVNIASIAGLVGRDRRLYHASGLEEQPVDYAAAKAGVIGLTRDLAALLAPDGIRVNAISPGGFGPRPGMPDAFAAAYADRTPLGRMGRDGVDLKGAVVFLASEASAYVTGHNLVVDGGFSTWR